MHEELQTFKKWSIFGSPCIGCIHRFMQWCGKSTIQAVELVGYMMHHFALR